MDINQNPEQIVRDKIDILLRGAGWAIQSKDKINLGEKLGVAIREYQTDDLEGGLSKTAVASNLGASNNTLNIIGSNLDVSDTIKATSTAQI